MYTNYSFDPNLGEGLCIFTSFHFPDSGLYLSNGFDFYFDLFLNGVTTENQQIVGFSLYEVKWDMYRANQTGYITTCKTAINWPMDHTGKT